MGQAKNRGTFEERKAEAIAREAAKPKPKPISPYGKRLPAVIAWALAAAAR